MVTVCLLRCHSSLGHGVPLVLSPKGLLCIPGYVLLFDFLNVSELKGFYFCIFFDCYVIVFLDIFYT